MRMGVVIGETVRRGGRRLLFLPPGDARRGARAASGASHGRQQRHHRRRGQGAGGRSRSATTRASAPNAVVLDPAPADTTVWWAFLPARWTARRCATARRGFLTSTAFRATAAWTRCCATLTICTCELEELEARVARLAAAQFGERQQTASQPAAEQVVVDQGRATQLSTREAWRPWRWSTRPRGRTAPSPCPPVWFCRRSPPASSSVCPTWSSCSASCGGPDW